MLGPVFYQPLESGFVIGLRVDEKHANARGRRAWRLSLNVYRYSAWLYGGGVSRSARPIDDRKHEKTVRVQT
jgi:hypothetical protein